MTTTLSSRHPGVLATSPAVEVSLAEPRGRLSLRARGDLTPFARVLGFALPERIGQRAEEHDIRAIRLGPDEWTLNTPMAAVQRLLEAFAAIYPDHPHSLVDISGREVSLVIEGAQASDLLSIGCARDVEAIPAGEGRRTMFDGTTVVLWKDAADSYRLDIWNSFAPHVLDLLKTGCAELAAEARQA
ncbi:sarcosine oxidase subunit gamma [Roseibium litorale]|uniref:Sarcosine oxidase subunit gamma n=1 Tax=Roseibium litorale TaxID=2803841 RepID=A0ABR9CN94_9HYPH|nr:sarcosine oxidase subunit gamma family protein [Roseibium litorale]MBD8892134.1 sarcosine oxidase subunit gamma [Roseibium litorale]